jgi:predicted transcriptional regulator
MLPPFAKRVLAYFDMIESVGGRASKTDLFRISANVTNRDRMTKRLCERKLLQEVEDGGHTYYIMTDWGKELHDLLKNHEYIGPLFEELAKSRIQRS